MPNTLSERMLRDAAEQLRRQSMQREESRRREQMMIYGNAIQDISQYNGSFQMQSATSFRTTTMLRKRLRLEMDGFEIFLEFEIPEGEPLGRMADRVARYSYEAFQRFPRGWSRSGNQSGERREEEDSEPDNDRFGAAFE